MRVKSALSFSTTQKLELKTLRGVCYIDLQDSCGGDLEGSTGDRMSTAEKKAWNDRALMEGTLLTAQQELVSYCGEDSPGERKVQRLMNNLQSAWESL